MATYCAGYDRFYCKTLTHYFKAFYLFQDTMGWGENDRGVSFTFGAEVVAKFLHKHDFDLICRAHQVPYKYSW